MTLDYVNLVLQIRRRLELLNEEFHQVVDSWEERTGEARPDMSAATTERLSQSCVDLLLHLRGLTSHRCAKMAALANDAFGTSLLFLLATVFAMVVFTAFFCISGALTAGGGAPVWWSVVSSAAWFSLYSGQAAAAVWACAGVGAQLAVTRGSVQDLLLCPRLGAAAREQLRLLRQLARGEAWVFTAGGVFRLDARLLGSVAVASTSYLLVLLQMSPGPGRPCRNSTL
ncbi:putative gustatory receptor 28b [Bacillus rossius redtenbacheri]|uniref:putative gustatory receptor 28b n=1 Tax=Bacillus rossius redtenbacheri TaxID=93214 RepID=UPI002FDD8B65